MKAYLAPPAYGHLPGTGEEETLNAIRAGKTPV